MKAVRDATRREQEPRQAGAPREAAPLTERSPPTPPHRGGQRTRVPGIIFYSNGRARGLWYSACYTNYESGNQNSAPETGGQTVKEPSEMSDHEMRDLRKQIEQFKQEKERVRAIVGRVGGMPTVHVKVLNIVFIVFVAVCLVITLYYARSIEIIMGELAIAAVSVKLMYLMHSQARVNHFQLWILSSLEWRLSEMVRDLAEIQRKASAAAALSATTGSRESGATSDS
jgi:hypothetical protein